MIVPREHPLNVEKRLPGKSDGQILVTRRSPSLQWSNSPIRFRLRLRSRQLRRLRRCTKKTGTAAVWSTQLREEGGVETQKRSIPKAGLFRTPGPAAQQEQLAPGSSGRLLACSRTGATEVRVAETATARRGLGTGPILPPPMQRRLLPLPLAAGMVVEATWPAVPMQAGTQRQVGITTIGGRPRVGQPHVVLARRLGAMAVEASGSVNSFWASRRRRNSRS